MITFMRPKRLGAVTLLESSSQDSARKDVGRPARIRLPKKMCYKGDNLVIIV